ncbi:MAG: serine/threonine protein kinase, partial [Planctomycetes bacterium]|nr:serine/threonine protein kinase [Planctomycetota bacterium]
MQQIGPYRLVDQLGRGGTAVVFRAVGPRGEQLAVKVLHRQGGVSRQRFMREAQVLSELSHPAIVPLRSVGEDQGRLYLAMPYYAGRSLADRVADEGPLPAPEAVAIAEALADGLAYVHDHGVLHRDIKPDNVLLDLEGAARLTDFGLARRTDSEEARLSKSGALMGTPGFWAPEQAGSGARVGPATDVYGLGATLYFMLTGAPPIHGGSLVDIMRAVNDDAVVRPSKLVPGISAELDRICMRCLEKQPADRFASARELHAALADLDPLAGAGRRPGKALLLGAAAL